MDNAADVLENGDATQEGVDSALAALQEAVSALTETEKSALQNLYDEYKDVQNDNYTDASWSAFQAVLTEAKAVLGDGDASQDSVNRVLAALIDAFQGLKAEGPTEPESSDNPDLPHRPGASEGNEASTAPDTSPNTGSAYPWVILPFVVSTLLLGGCLLLRKRERQ